MLTPSPKFTPSLIACAAAAALLAACGGGGSDTADAAAIDDSTATAYAANATQIASDASSATDAAVQSAQTMIALAAAASAGDDRATALAVAAATTTHNCPGGGTATLSITGGTPESVVNGQLDAGEVHAVAFAACKDVTGAATLNGSMAMTVLAASGDTSNGTLGLGLVFTDLSAALGQGSASLNGSVSRTVTVSTDAGGVRLASHFVAPSLTLATHYNTRNSSFTLSAADIQRSVTLVGGLPQSSTISGTHTLSATLPNGSYAYTVATNGGASYSASGAPVSGDWTLTLPQNLIGVTVANGQATITVDKGKDGTIDRTIIVPVPTLVANAG
ncbi:MAG: hypothetical protein ABI702_03420 [Burkholderiales bacterium]